MGSRPELNNSIIYGDMILRNSYTHDKYAPELESSNAFKFLRYLNSKSPTSENKNIPPSLFNKKRTRFKLLKPID